MKFDKINIDRASLNAEDIAKGKSFEGLMNEYNGVSTTKPWYKSIGLYTAVGVLAIALTASAWYLNNKDGQDSADNQAVVSGDAEEIQSEETALYNVDSQENIAKANNDQTAAINPPFGDIIDRNDFTVDAAKGGVFNIENSQLTIPTNAFVDGNGNVLVGEVEMEFTEYHDKADLLISGIPMSWQEGDEEMQFETGGMIEIRAKQNGEEVFLAEGKSISVEMQTDVPTSSTDFNEYVFNEETALWEEIGPMDRRAGGVSEEGTILESLQAESTPNIEPLSQELLVIEERIVEHKKTKPSAPEVLSSEAIQIALDFNEEEFPELIGYKDVLWEVNPDRFDASQGEKEWTEVLIKKGLDEGSYVVTFKKPGDRYVVQCKPVVDEADLVSARSTFERKFDQYNNKLVELKREEAAAKKKLAEERAEQRKQALIRRQQIAAARDSASEQYLYEGYMFNYFNVKQLGIYNCDNPKAVPKDKMYSNPRFFVNGKETPVQSTVFLMASDINAVFSLYPNYGISYSPKSRNMFLTILPSGKIAMAVNAGIEERTSTACDVKMVKFDRKIKSKNDVLAIMDQAESLLN